MRRRLNLTVLAVTAMVTVAFLVPLGLVVKVVASDRALSVADQEARSLASVLASKTSRPALDSVLTTLNMDGSGRSAAVFLPDGTRIGAPLNVPHDELTLARRGKAFSASSGSATRVWLPVRTSSGVVAGVVNVPDQLLDQGVMRAWLVLAAVGVAALLLALVLSDRLGRSLVRSIKQLDNVTRRLSQGELEARVQPAGPREIEDVGRAVNRLGERIIELLELEREQAADLSHRLRTPLTALALEVDSLPDHADRHRIGAAVHELSQAVNSVIVEVRQNRPARAPEADITATVRERLLFWSVLADEQARPWTSDLPEERIIVAVPPADLAAAVDALLGNVLAHTPERTGFRIELTGGPTSAVLVIEDDGPGLPAGPVDRRGHSGAGSTGLGLDIVRRTAEQADGSMTIGSRSGGGARVEMRLARADRVQNGALAGGSPAPDRVSEDVTP